MSINNFVEIFRENIFLNRFESAGGIAKLEGLQTHKSEDIYNKAIKILENFFESEEFF